MKQPPIKVAFVIDALRVGGAERLLLELFSHLPKTDFECRVYTIVEQGELVSQVQSLGVTVTLIGKRGKVSWGTVSRLRAAWRDWKPDVVHTHLFAGDTYGRLAAWRSGIPVVTTEHNMNLDEAGFKAWVRMVLSHLNFQIIAVSRAVKDYSVNQEHLSTNKIIVVHNGVDGKKFIPGPTTKNKIPVVGMTSRLHANKGHQYLFQALGLIKDIPFKVVILGDGPERPQLEKQAETLGIADRIQFTGLVHEVVPLLAGIDVLVLPTMQEGFGLSVVEAMLMEKSVLAFDTGPMNEVIDQGVTGVLVPPGDIPELSEALRRLLQDAQLRERLGKAGRQVALSKFSLDYMVQAYIKIYRQAVD